MTAICFFLVWFGFICSGWAGVGNHVRLWEFKL